MEYASAHAYVHISTAPANPPLLSTDAILMVLQVVDIAFRAKQGILCHLLLHAWIHLLTFYPAVPCTLIGVLLNDEPPASTLTSLYRVSKAASVSVAAEKGEQG